MAERFDHTLCPIERANFRQHMGRIRSLTPTCFEPAPFFTEIQDRLQKAFFCRESHQTSPKFT